MKCPSCGIETVGSYLWAKMSATERAEARADGYEKRYGAGGVCGPCFVKPTSPAGPERHGLRYATLEAWKAAGEPVRNTPEFRQLAETLGIQRASLVRSLQRAGVLPILREQP